MAGLPVGTCGGVRVRMQAGLLLVVLLSGLPLAAEVVDPACAPVATVDGVVITLRQIEDAVLKKGGADALTDWVQRHLARLDWSTIKDSDPILVIGGITLTRKDLVVQLLKPASGNGGYAGSGGKAREDLINAALVRAAIIKAHLTLDQASLDDAWASMEREFHDGQEEAREHMSFATYIRTKEGMDADEFRRQPGFLMLAGLRKLTLARALQAVSEADIMTYFDDHHERWDVPAAARLCDIYIPYFSKDGGTRATQVAAFHAHYRALSSKSEDFATIWSTLSKTWDPDAGAGGDLGWVTPDGARRNPAARRLPPEVMQRVMAVRTTPTLLEPVASAAGIDLVRVDALRPGTSVIYRDVRDRVLQDLLESTLQERMEQTMHELRLAADIRYRSLPDAIERLVGP